jgi:hypothetical protein
VLLLIENLNQKEEYMFLRRRYYKITFIIVFLFCWISLFAEPERYPENINPMDLYGTSSEYSTSAYRGVDSLNCKAVGGWHRGPCFAVFVVDTLAYIGAGYSMNILNVKDSTNPVLLGEIKLPGRVRDIYVQDTIVYVADEGSGVRIINVSNPDLPVEIGLYDPINMEDCQSIRVKDTLAYITEYEGLRIINVTDPSSPVEIGLYDAISGNEARRIYLQDTLAYVTTYSRLFIINIADPSSPVQISSFSIGENACDVWLQDTLAFVTAGENDLHIINVSDPSTPFEINSYDIPDRSSYGIWIKDTLAYLVGEDTNWPYPSSLQIINIANPSSPVEIGSYNTLNSRCFFRVFIKGMNAYVTDPGKGLSIIDVSNPSFPLDLGEFSTNGIITSVFIKDTLIYVTTLLSDLYIINIADASAPTEIGNCDTPGESYKIYVLDTLAYIADGDSGLCIINVSDPSSPEKVGSYDIDGRVYSVWAKDTIAYVANADSGLHIINASDPFSPVEIGFYDYPGYHERSLWIEDTIAYFNGHIIDISNPFSPSQIGDINYSFRDIFIKDTLAYLISDDYFYIFNVSDPSSPIKTNNYYPIHTEYFFEEEAVWIQDTLAYIVYAEEYSGSAMLNIINVANPQALNEAGHYCICHYYLGFISPVDVCSKDSLIYMAFDNAGLLILKYTGSSGGIEELPMEKDLFNTINISGTLEINYSVSERQKVKIEIFNTLGQKLACPLDAVQEKGNYSINWKGEPGIYFIRMQMGRDVYRKKAVLIN